jgi:hypothetical protein
MTINPITLNAGMLSPTAKITRPFENIAKELTWPRN